ncbi:hypothetical protein [Amycolatopsis sp. GM8]|uniref:hypothetical protein n=1 Tax=Amycolatopsis sp. GM8 TaxID=2896530 RepID=UPI001F48E074|nr:hypothetical protein [Amycolatopsis sp. GM8]
MIRIMGILAMVAALVTALMLWLPAPGQHEPDGTAGMMLGVTHGQYSLDSWLPPDQRASGERILGATPLLQNQHIMGFGVGNPEPAPGDYDWSRLDERMDLIGRTGGVPVITLCCAPDWMKGGQAGTTNWDDLAAAPQPAHFGDFATLAAKVAERYPQVRYFQVWNELKGFWDDSAGGWDIAGFTDFYNQVYDAVKKVRPDALIGGPYVVLDLFAATTHPSAMRGAYGVVDQRSLDAITYWNTHKHGADFVALDASTLTRDQGLITSPGAASAIYADATRWARNLTGLPVWWSEFYPQAPENTDQARAVVTLDAVARAAEAGAAAMLLWQPQASADLPYAALWSAPPDVGPTSLTRAWTWLAPRLREGSVRITRDVPDSLVRFTDGPETLTLNLSGSAQQRLAPYSITLD